MIKITRRSSQKLLCGIHEPVISDISEMHKFHIIFSVKGADV